MADSRPQPASIKLIASKLGVSIGTVDRALHGRSGISAGTREKVLQAAKALNYTPNAAARSLKLSRRMRIGIFLPEQIALFFDVMRTGMRVAASSLVASTDLEVAFHSYARLDEGDRDALAAAEWKQYDGIVLAPGEPARMAAFLKQSQPHPPVVFVANDAQRSERLTSVAVDAGVSGSIAAELLGRTILEPGKVATITGDRRFQDHADKLRGFAGGLALMAPHLSLLAPVESHERPEYAYQAAMALFRAHPDLGGLYISTANSLPVLQAAEEAGIAGRLQIIATDLYPELIGMIEAGVVLCSLYQRPFTQGRIAIETLGAYLLRGTMPRPVTRLAPHIVLRSNLCLFHDLIEKSESDAL